MIILGEMNDNHVLPMLVQNTITKDDFARVLPQMESLLNRHDEVRFYIKLEDFSGYELETLWQELKFDVQHLNEYGKTAVVGQKEWEKWGTKVSSLFTDAEMKFFPDEQADKAWDWVNAA